MQKVGGSHRHGVFKKEKKGCRVNIEDDAADRIPFYQSKKAEEEEEQKGSASLQAGGEVELTRGNQRILRG